MMKHIYQIPEVTVLEFFCNDVIATSGMGEQNDCVINYKDYFSGTEA